MNPQLHRYAIFLAILAGAVILTGALLTSQGIAAQQAQSAVSGTTGAWVHVILGIALIIFTLAIAIWISVAGTPLWLRTVAWFAVAALGLDGALSTRGFVHAMLAHLFISLFIVIGAVTASNWSYKPERVERGGRYFLRPLAFATPPIVVVQIALGAAYRHNVISVMPHVAGSMAVALLTLIVSAVVLQNFSRPKSLRRAATALISIVLAQVCLGVAAFLMIVLNANGTFAFMLITAGHVLIGAATLAASVVMAMEVRQCVSPEKS